MRFVFQLMQEAAAGRAFLIPLLRTLGNVAAGGGAAALSQLLAEGSAPGVEVGGWARGWVGRVGRVCGKSGWVEERARGWVQQAHGTKSWGWARWVYWLKGGAERSSLAGTVQRSAAQCSARCPRCSRARCTSQP